ncbi:MAG: M48 family metallopeptidase [Wenzhouxiangellaceae bacterium]|nr:M48 family metallopeptidase [Wenzhouxiangellaceae bacterium]
MNFFEQQDRARKQTRLLVLAFVLAVVAIVVAMNLVMLAIFGRSESAGQGWLSASFWAANAGVVLWTSLVTAGIILLASLYRSMQLRGGGSQVARELGGVEVTGMTTDPLRQRLLNVVEEMAIASGVPVPEVFVLEQESAINAFAAGWSPADAAVAVTRGTLETLSRDELQGVIAHEFSHVFNGDMRLNIRLMGVLFGILVLAIVGRKMLYSMRFSGRNRKGGGIAVVALAVLVIGTVGLFFGRWIQAAVSRQREYLADASAVQFTRLPDGIAGALKKIGAASAGSKLDANTDQVGHMLFASGLASRLFSTHPPLEDRIRKIDPSFEAAEFAVIAQQMDRHRQSNIAAAEHAAQARQEAQETRSGHALPGGLSLDPDTLITGIGRADTGQLMLASALLADMPKALERAAHSDEWAPELILFLLIARERQLRDKQLLLVAEALGSESEQQVRHLLDIEAALAPGLRLPLMELAFPALRRRPHDDLVRLMALVQQLIEADGNVDVFEYAMGRLLNREIEDTMRPPRKLSGGRKNIGNVAGEVADLLAILAGHGHPGDPGQAGGAIDAAIAGLPDVQASDPEKFRQAWQLRLDEIFRQLDELTPAARQQLIEAMMRCIGHDGKIIAAEYELVRLVAGMLRVPLPAVQQAGS